MVVDPRSADARGSAPSSCGRWMRPAKRLYQQGRQQTFDAPHRTFPRKRPRWRSNRPTRWRCSRRRRCITASIPARRASATRWWSTSTRRCWRILTRRVSPFSKTARAFPRKRLNVWHATRVAWRCNTPPTDGSSRLAREIPDDSSCATACVTPSRPQLPLSGLPRTVRAGPSHPSLGSGGPTTLSNSRLCSVAGIIERFTRKAIESFEGRTVKLCFRRPDGRILPEVPLPAGVPDHPAGVLRARNDMEGISSFARTPRRPNGAGSVSSSDTRSTSCILGARGAEGQTFPGCAARAACCHSISVNRKVTVPAGRRERSRRNLAL